jgi:hypothetical protein
MITMTYAHEAPMKEALSQYFRDNGFAPDGGYSDAWVDFKLGPIPFPFPNLPARKRALKVHDLHHVLTGYRTDIYGELEISAWEIGAGCKDFWAAWFLNLGGLAGGALVAPRRTFRAFVRGLANESLYGRDLEEVLGKTVAQMRASVGTDASPPAPRLLDAVRFGAAAAAGLITGGVFLAVGLVLAPVALAAGLVRKSPVAER